MKYADKISYGLDTLTILRENDTTSSIEYWVHTTDTNEANRNYSTLENQSQRPRPS